MTTFAISTTSKVAVTFTEGDVNAGVPGAGAALEELRWALMARAFLGSSQGGGFVISGYALPSSGGLTQDITLGDAIISGYLVRGTGVQSITLPANDGGGTAIRVYLRLTRDAGTQRVTGVALETVVEVDGEDPVLPADYLPLGRLTTNASAITDLKDYRSFGRVSWGAVRRITSTKYRMHYAGSGDWYALYTGGEPRVYFRTPYPRVPLRFSAFGDVVGTSGSIPGSTDYITIATGTTDGDIISFAVIG